MEKTVIEHFTNRLRKGEYASRYFESKDIPRKGLKGNFLELGCGALSAYFPDKLEVYGS